MNYIIITGASKGLGEALANKMISKDNHVLCISRTKNNSLIETARINGYNLDYFEYDLNDVDNLDELVENIFSIINISQAKTISLINNAGIVAPIKPIEKCNSQEIKKSISVNLIAPMILTSLFIKFTSNMKLEKRIINISSGAGKKPYFGWGCYCTSKSGIDLFTQCVGVEQDTREYPTKILSLAPGVIDTGMQVEIRSSNEEDFPQIERFKDLKDTGTLLQPSFVAEKITNILFGEEFENGGVIDIRS